MLTMEWKLIFNCLLDVIVNGVLEVQMWVIFLSLFAYFWHWSPAVWPLQLRQTPVLWWHSSVCPLHWHGLQLGKPQCPAWQLSQRWLNAPGRHEHCPVRWSQNWLREPSWLQSHAKERNKERKYLNFSTLIVARYVFLQSVNLTFASSRSKAIASWSTPITALANYIRPTGTLTSTHITLRAEWTLGVTLAS